MYEDSSVKQRTLNFSVFLCCVVKKSMNRTYVKYRDRYLGSHYIYCPYSK